MDRKESSLAQEKVKAKHMFSPFIAYLLLFYGCWIGWVYLIYSPMQALGTATLAYALANIAARLLLWVMPVFFYLRFIDHVHPVAYLKLNQYWKRGILLGLALSLLNFVGMLLRFGLPHPSLNSVTWNSVLSTSILIGLFEEIPFRGFVFQKLQERFPVWISNLLSSLLFLGIHLPGWMMLHALSWSNVLSIFVLGVIFAAIFYFSKDCSSHDALHIWAVPVTEKPCKKPCSKNTRGSLSHLQTILAQRMVNIYWHSDLAVHSACLNKLGCLLNLSCHMLDVCGQSTWRKKEDLMNVYTKGEAKILANS